jgi:hypothetical protein
MLKLYIPIAPATVVAIKEYLWAELPSVKSSHRLEATARGLGFKSYAALLQAAQCIIPTVVKPETAPFILYLRQHGFEVEPAHLYRTVARVAVSIVLEKAPKLSAHGYGFHAPQWIADLRRYETPQEKYKKFLQSRDELLSKGCLDEFLLAFAIAQKIRQTKTVRDSANSYHLTHIAERTSYVCADGTELGPRYVSNGAFITAALYAGFRMKTYLDHLGYDHINVCFNMPKREIGDLARATRRN